MNQISAYFKQFLNQLKAHWQIAIILFIAAILRFYKFSELPYMHDELSALLRTNFDSFGEVLEKGIKIDGHPALVQSFLYFWTKLFGYSEGIVKLPFILMSIGSVYWMYKLGSRWFNLTAGLVLAAIFATCEYPLMYGQIIRPYGSGLFFTLLMTYHWGELVFFKNYKGKHILYYILGAVLCSYNHHFSLLIAALIGLFGILFVEKSFRFKYILLSLIIPLLYLPHLSIFLYQLNIGGVEGWLGKPNPDFIWNFLRYVFHFSWVAFLGFLFVWAWASWNRKKHTWKLSAPQIFSLLLFTTNYAIAYFYSVYGTSVLQTSVLIFSFPFLLLFVVGFFSEQKSRTNAVLSFTLVITFGFSLIVQREYFKVFYVSTFKQLVLDANAYNKVHPCTTLFFSDLPKTKFYEPALTISPKYIFVQIPGFSLPQLDSLLRKSIQTDDYFCLAATSTFPTHYRALIQHYYPKEVETRNYFSAATHLFRKAKTDKDVLSSLKPSSNNWQGIDAKKWKNKRYQFLAGDEWGPGFHADLNTLVKKNTDVIDVQAKIKVKNPKQDVLLVLNCQDGDSIFVFRAASIADFHWNPIDSTVTLVHSIALVDTPFKRFKEPGFNTYLWNRDKGAFEVISFQVYYRKGNRYTYGLYEPIE